MDRRSFFSKTLGALACALVAPELKMADNALGGFLVPDGFPLREFLPKSPMLDLANLRRKVQEDITKALAIPGHKCNTVVCVRQPDAQIILKRAGGHVGRRRRIKAERKRNYEFVDVATELDHTVEVDFGESAEELSSPHGTFCAARHGADCNCDADSGTGSQ